MQVITILGHGAVGLSIGSLLLNSNCNDTKIHFYSLNKYEGSSPPFFIYSNNEQTSISADYFNDDELLSQTSIFIVCLKLYAIKNINKLFLQKVLPSAKFILISNGLNNADVLNNTLSKLFINGVLYISCKKTGNIITNYSIRPKLIFNSKEINIEHALSLSPTFLGLLKAAGFEINITSNFKWECWRKLIITSSVNGVSIWFECNPKEIFNSPERLSILKSVLKENINVAKTQGVVFSNRQVNRIINDILSMPGDCPPSMYLDFKNGKQTEINYLNRQIRDIARLNKIETPLNNLIIKKLNQ